MPSPRGLVLADVHRRKSADDDYGAPSSLIHQARVTASTHIGAGVGQAGRDASTHDHGAQPRPGRCTE